MKTLLLLLSLSAVGFGQQAKPAEKCVEGPMRKEASCPKPPKPKPSVKTFTVHCLERGCGKWTEGYQLFSDPCDGMACTGPVEMLNPKRGELAQKLSTSDKAPGEMLPRGFPPEGAGIVSVQDKAAVPVEPQNDYFQFTGVTPPSFTIMSQGDGCSWLGFQYDAKTKTCSMRITFDVNSQVVCTPLALNEQGKPEMTCSFKLIDKGGK